MTTSYDRVEYPTMPRSLGHPGHMHAMARMFGVNAAPVQGSRTLEIGCGDGVHLASCAYSTPDAQFIGFDLSREAISRGQNLIQRLGLKNLSLQVGDIMTWEADAPFDYIFVHGVYSWIPAPVRDALMALVARSLSTHGVACISYNAYPASYTRQMLWEMMKYHIGDRTDPEEMIEKALELARFIRLCRPVAPGEEMDLFDNDLDIVLNKQIRSVLYHDELAPINQPFYFHEFMDHARQHGLRFVSELEPHVMVSADLPPQIDQLLRTLSQVNPERREQYYDFACLRRFRQTIVAREPHEPKGTPDPNALRDLLISGNCGTDTIDFHSDQPMTFAAGTTAVQVSGTLAKAAMVVLVESRPRRLTFQELLTAAGTKIGQSNFSESEILELAKDLVIAWTSGLVILKGHRPHYVSTVSSRPVSSLFARDQLRSSSSVTSQLHLSMRFDDAPGRKLLELLDGTRTFDDLVRAIYPTLPADRPMTESEFRVGLKRNLEMLALSGLLVA